jgi:hypothetical protein
MATTTTATAATSLTHTPVMTAPVAIPASGPGALAGFETKCLTCGMVIRGSIVEYVRAEAAAHIRYHAEKAHRATRVRR